MLESEGSCVPLMRMVGDGVRRFDWGLARVETYVVGHDAGFVLLD
jgi:hypothetical protein